MTWRPRRRVRLLATGLAAAALWAPASPAGLLTTRETLADFRFAGDQIDYDPDPKTLVPARDGPLAFTVTEPALGLGATQSVHDPLRGSLHILMKDSNYGAFEGAAFDVFGSLPPLGRSGETVLLQDSIKALKPDSKPGALDFLNDHDRLTGPLVSRYRGVGIFMLVWGLDDQTWTQGFADGASTMELLLIEDRAVRPRNAEDRD